MNKRFKYSPFDKRSHRITAAVITAGILLLLLLFYYIDTSYYMAWVILNALAVIALFVLSIPRYVEIAGDAIEIHCIVDMTKIDYKTLVSVTRLEPADMRHCYPLLGSYGFFGYYGYYVDLTHWSVVRVYATEWNNFVEIEDIYERRYIISCSDPEGLMEAIEEAASGAEEVI